MKTYDLLSDRSVGPLAPIRHDRNRLDVHEFVTWKNTLQPLVKFQKLIVVGAGAVTGAITGYVYWNYVGYDEHTPLISSVWVSISLASVLSGVLAAIVSSPRQIEA